MNRSILLVALGFPAVAHVARADAPIVVNDKRDLPDADLNDGMADADLVAPGQQITLRAAIMHANFVIGSDAIELPKGKFKLKLQTVGVDSDATGDLDVTDDLNITGAGSKKTIIDAKKLGDRPFHVDDKTLVIQDVTIRNGRALDVDQPGGGIFAENTAILHVFNAVISGCKCTGKGGGIGLAQSNLIIENVLLTKNRADAGGGGISQSPGSFSDLEESTLSKNKSGMDGGGLRSEGAMLIVLNSTLSGNKASNGGGIWVKDGGDLNITGCTIAKNKAAVAASGLFEDTSGFAVPIAIGNTIFANDASSNYVGDGLTTNGGNIDTGTTCGFTDVTDQENTDPKLQPLKNNGGPTPTHAIARTSKAVDRGVDGLALPKDQRGVTRFDVPNKGTATADCGAFEFHP